MSGTDVVLHRGVDGRVTHCDVNHVRRVRVRAALSQAQMLTAIETRLKQPVAVLDARYRMPGVPADAIYGQSIKIQGTYRLVLSI